MAQFNAVKGIWGNALALRRNLTIVQACCSKVPGGDESTDKRVAMVMRAHELMHATLSDNTNLNHPKPETPIPSLSDALLALAPAAWAASPSGAGGCAEQLADVPWRHHWRSRVLSTASRKCGAGCCNQHLCGSLVAMVRTIWHVCAGCLLSCWGSFGSCVDCLLFLEIMTRSHGIVVWSPEHGDRHNVILCLAFS